MTPGARIAAAAAVLDAISAGAGAERALAGWARGARYAGSGDREAVRDLVYEALRRRRSLAVLGGAVALRGGASEARSAGEAAGTAVPDVLSPHEGGASRGAAREPAGSSRGPRLPRGGPGVGAEGDAAGDASVSGMTTDGEAPDGDTREPGPVVEPASGRQLMLGLMRLRGWDPALLTAGGRHALAPPDAGEAARLVRAPEADMAAMPEGVALDLPDWLLPRLRAALGPELAARARSAQIRAPLFLRAHAGRITAEAAAKQLAAEGIEASPHPRVATALRVTAHPRALRRSRLFLDGLVELQDLSSQEAMADLPDPAGLRVLDLCAGAGGKALALAARGAGRDGGSLHAHDIDPARLRDLPERAARAGARVLLLPPGEAARAAPHDLVLADVPCSGSGTWRRDPEGKWRLTPARLAELTRLQARLLRQAAGLVAPGGWLAYTTCSVLCEENEIAVDRFLAELPGWRVTMQKRYGADTEGDGFFLSLLCRD